jgi:hypothetical protein
MYLENSTEAGGMLTLGVQLSAPGARKRARDEPPSPPRSPKNTPPRSPKNTPPCSPKNTPPCSPKQSPPRTPSNAEARNIRPRLMLPGIRIDPSTDDPRTPGGDERGAWTPLSPSERKDIRDSPAKYSRLLEMLPELQSRAINTQFGVYTLRPRSNRPTYVFKDCILSSKEVDAWNAYVHPPHESACKHVVAWLHHDNRPVMPFVKGISMLTYIKHHACMPDDVLLPTMRQMLSGLHHINVAKQAAHGDLSLNNVLIDARGHVVIVDVDNAMRSLFSKLNNTPLLLEGATCSPSIMSPETVGMYTHGAPVMIPADAWAAGMLLLYMLHGLDVRLGTRADVGGGRFGGKTSAGISPIKYPDNPAPYMLWLGGLLHSKTDPVVLHATRTPPAWAAAVLAGALRSDPATRMDVSALQGCL